MTTQLITQEAAAFSAQQLQMLTDTIMKGATAEEVAFFAEVCKRTRLDPFRKQIHAVKRWDTKQSREVWSYQTGIDGYRAIAARTGLYAGSDEPVMEETPKGEPLKATVTVWKLVAGQRVPFTASARWDEYVQLARDKETKQWGPNSMWRKMPFTMLGKCAEALALRKAFPEELSGVHTEEEMAQADNPEPERKQRFDLERRTLDPRPEPVQQKKPEPPKEAPAPKTEPAPVVEAEVVPEEPVTLKYDVPDEIRPLIRGGWKQTIWGATRLGDLKVSQLRQEREQRPDDPAILASIYDEAQAILKRLGRTEDRLAAYCEAEHVVEYPVDLWQDTAAYAHILEILKQWKLAEQ